MNGKSEIITMPRISWGAVFAGVVIVLAVQLMLSMLGLGIGLSTINPLTEAQPMAGLGLGSAIWWIVVSIVALYLGGWVSSRMSGVQSSLGGMLHGLVTWGISTLIMLVLFAGTIGAIVSGGVGMARSAISATGEAAKAAPADTKQNVQAQIQDLQQQLKAREQSMSAQEKQDLQQRIRQLGGQVAQTAAAASLGSFFVLLLGGIAAALGGAMGRLRQPVRV